MADPLPKFDAPPVVETVLSLQFESLPNFTSAFAGWFWKVYLRDFAGDWSKTVDAPRLEDQIELFGDDEVWGAPALKIRADSRSRTQIIRADEQRMVQLQDSRIVLNWKREKGTYPSYGVLIDEFRVLLALFRKFAQDAGCGELKSNQWELTYVHFLYKGDLWNTFDDLPLIFNQICVPLAASIANAESMVGYIIGNRQGRLHVNLSHVRTQPEGKDALRYQLTARGPIKPDDASVLTYFDLGHEAIVRSFADMTTQRAHTAWKRIQ